MAIGLLVLGVIVGLLFEGHGAQKLFGWFGGHGPEGTAAFLGSLGYRPSRTMALVAGVTETLAGAMLALGFLTPVASAAIIGVMVNATMAMHLRNGLWNSNGGFELPLVYATVAAGLAFAGRPLVRRPADRVHSGPDPGGSGCDCARSRRGGDRSRDP